MADVRLDLVRRRPFPSVYSSEEPPPGVEKMFLPQSVLNDRYRQFGAIQVRSFFAHTEAASRSVTVDVMRNVVGPPNTTPTFVTDHDGRAGMFLPLFIKPICTLKADYWSACSETQDNGSSSPWFPNPWTPEQVDTLGCEAAYIHMVRFFEGGNMPLAPLPVWDAAGVAVHVDPAVPGNDYPNTTKYRGKTCPTDPRRAQKQLVIDTAKAYVNYWTGEDDVTTIQSRRVFGPTRVDRTTNVSLNLAGTVVWQHVDGKWGKFTIPADCSGFFGTVTVIDPEVPAGSDGFVQVWPKGAATKGEGVIVSYDANDARASGGGLLPALDSQFRFSTHRTATITVDITGYTR